MRVTSILLNVFVVLSPAVEIAAADVVGLRWADTPNAQKHDGPGTVELYVRMFNPNGTHAPGPEYQLSGVGGYAVCITGDCTDLLIDNFVQVMPEWGVQGFEGGIGAAAVASGANFVEDIIGPTPLGETLEFKLTTFDVTFTGLADGTEVGFGFDFVDSLAGVMDGTGSSITWHMTYALTYSGYIAYDEDAFGWPGWGCHKSGCPSDQSRDNPLIMTRLPEPVSLAMIALGGFGLRRRARD